MMAGCSPLTQDTPAGAADAAATLVQCIVDAGVDAVEAFYDTDGCGLEGYVSHGPPAVDRPDVVVAWLEHLHVDPNRQAPCVAIPRAVVRTQLWVGCWPDVQRDPIERSEISVAAYRSTVVGQTWFDRTPVLARRALGGVPCSRWRVSPLVPLGPLGGTVGWQFTVTASLGD